LRTPHDLCSGASVSLSVESARGLRFRASNAWKNQCRQTSRPARERSDGLPVGMAGPAKSPNRARRPLACCRKHGVHSRHLPRAERAVPHLLSLNPGRASSRFEPRLPERVFHVWLSGGRASRAGAQKLQEGATIGKRPQVLGRQSEPISLQRSLRHPGRSTPSRCPTCGLADGIAVAVDPPGRHHPVAGHPLKTGREKRARRHRVSGQRPYRPAEGFRLCSIHARCMSQMAAPGRSR
jgi:hypothetical protein